MNITEASTVLALLHHLDGSQLLDEPDLTADLVILHDQAVVRAGGSFSLDEDTLCDTLTEVAQRFADADYYNDEPARPIENVPVGGDRL
ncbi:MAG TPA: hypothetical protein VIM47_01050 [Dermatophilaceae bacterium]